MFQLAIFTTVLCLLSMGCSTHKIVVAGDVDAGTTFVLPGIGGASFVTDNIAKGLLDGDVQGQIEVFDWTTGNPLRSFEHLQDEQRVFDQALQLSYRLRDSIEQLPPRTVSVVAHSGGAGVAVRALEMLPDGYQVGTLVLIAPAISRDYPLDVAAAQCRDGVWLYRSPLDFQTSFGTLVAGTIDRENSFAAGSYGLKRKYPGVTEVPYRPRMLLLGNTGSHRGATIPRFVRSEIAPKVKQSQLRNY